MQHKIFCMKKNASTNRTGGHNVRHHHKRDPLGKDVLAASLPGRTCLPGRTSLPFSARIVVEDDGPAHVQQCEGERCERGRSVEKLNKYKKTYVNYLFIPTCKLLHWVCEQSMQVALLAYLSPFSNKIITIYKKFEFVF